jgi:hypothetical protein
MGLYPKSSSNYNLMHRTESAGIIPYEADLSTVRLRQSDKRGQSDVLTLCNSCDKEIVEKIVGSG